MSGLREPRGKLYAFRAKNRPARLRHTAGDPAATGVRTGRRRSRPGPRGPLRRRSPLRRPSGRGHLHLGSDTDDRPTLRLGTREDAPEGEKVLTGSYDINGYGGFT